MTTPEPPEWARAIPSTSAVRLPPNPRPSTRPLTNGQLLQIGAELIEQFIRRVVLAVVGFFVPNEKAFDQLVGWAEDIAGGISDALSGLADLIGKLLSVPGQVIGSIVNVVMDGISTVGQFLSGLFNAFTGQNQSNRTAVHVATAATAVTSTANTAGTNAIAAGATARTARTERVRASRIPRVHLSTVSDAPVNLLASPDFPDATALSGSNEWEWDGTQDHTGVSGSGSAKALGSDKYLLSNEIDVAPGESFTLSAWTRYAGVSATAGANAVRISVVAYLNSAEVGTAMVAGVASPAGSSGWMQLSGSYTVPASGVDSIRLRLGVTAALSAGTVWFDDIFAGKTGISSGTIGGINANANSALTNAGQAQSAANLAQNTINRVTGSGSNLVISPDFEDATISRIAYAATSSGYSTEQAHGGIRSWKWTQAASDWCGLYLATNTTFAQVWVQPADKYELGAWVFPHSANTETGEVEFGAMLTDSTGVNPTTYVYTAFEAGSEVPKGEWTKLSTTVSVPAGYDTAQFFIQANNATPSGSVFYVDDVVVREITASYAASASAHLAQSSSDTFAAYFNTPRTLPPWISNLADDATFAQTLIDGVTAPALGTMVLIPVTVSQDRVYNAIKFGIAGTGMTSCQVGLYDLDETTGACTKVVDLGNVKSTLNTSYNLQTIPLPTPISVQRGEVYLIAVLQTGGTAAGLHRWSSTFDFTTGLWPRYMGTAYTVTGLGALPATFNAGTQTLAGTKFWGALGTATAPVTPGSRLYSDSFTTTMASWTTRYGNSLYIDAQGATGSGVGYMTYNSRLLQAEQEVSASMGIPAGRNANNQNGIGVLSLRGDGSGRFVYLRVLDHTGSTLVSSCGIYTTTTYSGVGTVFNGGVLRQSLSLGTSSTAADGVWRFTAISNVYRAYQNGVLRLTWTDGAAPGGSAFPYGPSNTELGIGMYNDTAGLFSISNWYGKDL